MSCKCQECGNQYKIDLLIPDYLWEKIKPNKSSDGSGMLCGKCIMEKIHIEEPDFFFMSKDKK